ncbi:hypothetical protein [Candidatus Nitrospira allomarina]|uniref:Uncharacterized protein n=1 Tax=Candidatus Nitrospira allomarina TaxID=3020900 RepID=A0AA96GGL7_9BACT|nr:hypothetical protein [Candidatus Nitrospira allomarina]WNM59720.1 hypothetical protein PP769_08185 [Candidatus Nitrospira allomarina]
MKYPTLLPIHPPLLARYPPIGHQQKNAPTILPEITESGPDKGIERIVVGNGMVERYFRMDRISRDTRRKAWPDD